MILETKRKTEIHIASIRETGMLLLCLSQQIKPLLLGTSNSHEFAYSIEGSVHFLGLERCILQPTTLRSDSFHLFFKMGSPKGKLQC